MFLFSHFPASGTKPRSHAPQFGTRSWSATSREGTWVEIQNIPLGLRPVGNVKGKIILLASAKKRRVNQVQEELAANGEQVDYAFRVTNEVYSNMLELSVGGVELEMLVESGASNNIVDEETWEDLKAAPIDRKLYAHAFRKPLPVKVYLYGHHIL